MKAGFGLFTGKQAKPMQEYFSIYFIKEKQLFQTNGKDALQFYRQREKKKIGSLFFARVVRSNKTAASRMPIGKNPKQRRINIPF